MRGSLTTKNFQNGLTFAVVIPRLQESSFFIQRVNIPEIVSGVVTQENLFNAIQLPGTSLEYSNLEMTFLVQEGLKNWYDFYMWIHGLNFPQNFEQYIKLKSGLDKDITGKTYPLQRPFGQGNIYSNIDLIISSSQGNPLLRYTFVDAFPISLTGIDIDASNSETILLTSVVSFRYSYYTISDDL
jgi:hypothetical protein